MYVYTYNSTPDSGVQSRFQEVLLYERMQKRPIFTSILNETGQIGFNNETWDFQMIVADDGHNGDTATTTYYFYVELE
jgi:hypothetical protein